MSTSFLMLNELERWAAKLGLKIKLYTSDPYVYDAEYRIFKGNKSEHIFQGSADRCSDFIRGYIWGGL